MKQQLYELLSSQGDLSWESIAMNIGFAALIGFVIFISYAFSHRNTIYSRKFNISLIALTILTATVMTVIGNNIALSLGMVGALSIVRFRTAIKDSRDTVYIFWTIIVGICCGVQNYYVAAIGSAAIFVIFLLFGCIKSDSRILLIVRGARSIETSVESLVYKSFDHKAILRAKNTSGTDIEFIYEFSDRVLKRAQRKNPNLTNSFYQLGEVQYVNFVLQNDDITN